jgi:hypothetical protein
LHVGVEGLVVAETGGVCYGTLGVIEIVFEASDLKIQLVSLWFSFRSRRNREISWRRHTAQGGRPVRF